jgi:phage-related protein
MTKRWGFYETPMGADVVAKELAKCRLAASERLRLGKIMERAANNALLPKDRKSLGGGLLELRLDCGERIFRLFYSETEDSGPLLLALKFVNKKSTQGIQTDPGDIETARKRLSEWQTRTTSDGIQP